MPWSVVGGASKSGFCWSMAMFCGPRIVAPSEPRMGCTSAVVSGFHIMPFARSEAYATVAVAAGADVVDASATEEAKTLLAGFDAVDTSAAEERMLMAGAGAAATKPDSNTAQTTEERKRLIIG